MNELDLIVQRIMDVFHPLRIILFGSAARGEAGQDSDIDLLVVMPDGTPRLRFLARGLFSLSLWRPTSRKISCATLIRLPTGLGAKAFLVEEIYS